jgi:hypothetical protein
VFFALKGFATKAREAADAVEAGGFAEYGPALPVNFPAGGTTG